MNPHETINPAGRDREKFTPRLAGPASLDGNLRSLVIGKIEAFEPKETHLSDSEGCQTGDFRALHVNKNGHGGVAVA